MPWMQFALKEIVSANDVRGVKNKKGKLNEAVIRGNSFLSRDPFATGYRTSA